MTALKAHQVDRFIQAPDLDRGVILVYGPDHGRVHETAQQLMRVFGRGNDDPMSELVLDMQALIAEPGLLAVEADTPSMFGGLRRIRIRNATKALTPTLQDILDTRPDAIIILEAGNLPPRDSLRALAEKHAMARTLPCYADTARDLAGLIESSLASENIQTDADVVPTLQAILGNDREITRRELEKLILFAQNDKRLSREDVLALCGDNAMLAIDAILDTAGTGRAEQLDTALQRARAAGLDTQRVLTASLNHFSWLRRARQQVDAGQSARQVLDAQRPRPHFSRRADLEQQLRIWDDKALASAIERLYTAIAESRRAAALSGPVAARALLAVCIAAAHR